MDDFNSTNGSLTLIAFLNIFDDYKILTHPLNIFAILFFVIMIFLGTLGNGLTVLVYCMHRPLRAHSINIYMVHTSVVNLVISALFNPIYIIIYFSYIDGFIKFIVVGNIIMAMNMANVLSMYSLCAVATNRYLLLTRPKTTFLTWCVPRRRIACVVLGLWSATIVTTVPNWVPFYLFMYSRGNQTLQEAFGTVSNILTFFWFLPLVIVPLVHFITLRKIRVHRQRMERQISPLSADNNTVKEQLEKQANDVDLPGQTVALERHSESLVHPGPSCTRDEVNIIAPRHMIQNDSVEKLDDDPRVHEADTRKDIWVTCSQCCSSFRSRRDVQDGANLRKHGMAKSEARFLKMMLLMYTVLIISSVTLILSFTPVLYTVTMLKMRKFAYLIPVYSASMPYIFLWSNKNFRSAAVNLIAKMNLRKVKNRQKVGP